MIKSIIYIAIGGAAGSVLRYFFQLAFDRGNEVAQPWGIFLANVIGCFFIGIFAATFALKSHLDPALKLLLITGFCGAFTTFSTYIFNGMKHFQQGEYSHLFVHGVASIVAGYIAVLGGYALANLLFS